MLKQAAHHIMHKEQGLADLLNYAHFVDDGVILNKDGAFMVSYQYRGPDIYSATTEKLDALAYTVNRMMTFLEDGWMIYVDEMRVPSVDYPDKGYFPDSVSLLIDQERRAFYEKEGAHFENLQFLTFVWKFPKPLVNSTRHLFVEGLEDKEGGNNLTTLLRQFLEMVERCAHFISAQLTLTKLGNEDLLSFLNTCITGELLLVASPPEGCYLDVVLGRRPLVGGYLPKIGEKYVYAISLMGYLNAETTPGLLEEIATYPMVYRWSNRFVPFSQATTEREIKRYERDWNNKVKGLMGLIKETISGRTSAVVNEDAAQMSAETSIALTANSNQSSRFGYWTSTLILMHEDTTYLDHAEKNLKKYLEQRGFTSQRETINALEAWRGSIPGHGSANLRRFFLDSMNLAHILPLHSIWAGRDVSSPSSKLPQNSPPIFYAATTGKTPFRFHIDVMDVGHLFIAGPTGAGKTLLLAFLTVQFLRYKNAQVFIFDKDFSHRSLTEAVNGEHYNIGDAKELSFCVLGKLETETQCMTAISFIETLVSLQNVVLTPQIRSDISATIKSISAYKGSRTLTIFCNTVQNELVRSALKYYTIDGTMKLLDAEKDALGDSHFQTFEMDWLLKQRPEIYVPVLFYIFNQIEERLSESSGSSRPTLIVLEEAWLYISHPVFAEKLRDWLKTMRKKNARVVFATQSLSDLYNPETKTLTQVTSSIISECPTKIYLPNKDMDTETQSLYQKMGLNDRQLEIIKEIAIPKQHYYVVSREGDRLVDLGFHQNCLALAFLGLSLSSGGSALIQCKQDHGEYWIQHWLKRNNLDDWSDRVIHDE
jgi:type IV secretion system protein VirB4